MATGLLEKTDSAYAAGARRREQLTKEKASLMLEDGRLRDRGERAGEGRRGEIGARLRLIDAELTDTRGEYDSLKREALARAGEQIRASSDYRKAVRAAALGLGENLTPWLPLASLSESAYREGVHLPALPPSIMALLTEARAWVREQVRLGLLDPEALPKTLKGLL
jgi:hypothetical protein